MPPPPPSRFPCSPPTVRLRAAAIIRRSGQVLLHRAEGDRFWALPGGGIEPGECAAQALVRELQEELHTLVVPGALACVVENFFTLAGVSHHETGLYLLAEPASGSLLERSAGPYQGTEGHRRLEFAWFEMADLQHIDLRPCFLREALSAIGRGDGRVLHAVHRDDALAAAQPFSSSPLEEDHR